jgi:RecJ-like exonuclease
VRFLIAFSLVMVGCVMTLPADDSTLTAELASETARAMVQMRATPTPTPEPAGDKCENCNGTGKVGDGRVFVKCPECDGTGKRKK